MTQQRQSAAMVAFRDWLVSEVGKHVRGVKASPFSASCPRLSRASTSYQHRRKKDVDGIRDFGKAEVAEDKPGHDGEKQKCHDMRK